MVLSTLTLHPRHIYMCPDTALNLAGESENYKGVETDETNVVIQRMQKKFF